jgi:1-acyl-sn-glycerol-3-phosphate acyltransferase
MFFSWVFLSRRWEADRPRFEHRMGHLSNPSLQQAMWLLIFPEGTNLSGNTRGMSEKWASKMNIHDLKHVLLPRTRGLQFCLEALNPTVKWVYDCTIAYEGIP